jgi:hypothetical protein
MNLMSPREMTAEIRLMPLRAPVARTIGVPTFAPMGAARLHSVRGLILSFTVGFEAAGLDIT